MIDLSTMKGVRVDPKNRTVRVGAGCTTGDVDNATHAFGQAVPFGIISTTGVAGLTLSGGHGYLSRQYGLTVENLLEADVFWPTAVSSPLPRRRTPTCCGLCAAAAEISAS